MTDPCSVTKLDLNSGIGSGCATYFVSDWGNTLIASDVSCDSSALSPSEDTPLEPLLLLSPSEAQNTMGENLLHCWHLGENSLSVIFFVGPCNARNVPFNLWSSSNWPVFSPYLVDSCFLLSQFHRLCKYNLFSEGTTLCWFLSSC